MDDQKCKHTKIDNCILQVKRSGLTLINCFRQTRYGSKSIIVMVNLKRIKEDFSYSALISGLLAVVISYAGPLVIIFQAGQVSHLPVNVMSSWVWAVSIGSGLST